MSSPFPPETKRGTEETLESLSRAREWLSRIDTKNDATNLDLDFISELQEEEERLRERYRIRTTEVAIGNFVFNQVEKVEDIMFGDLDTKVSALREVSEYINEEFGSERPLSLSKEELMWLVAQEVKSHQNRVNGVDRYNEEPFSNTNLDSKGSRPDKWEDEEFPRYNRNN